MDFDKKILEVVQQVNFQKNKILDDFAKSYLAAEFLEGKDLVDVIKNIELNQMQMNEEGKIGWKFWFRKNIWIV